MEKICPKNRFSIYFIFTLIVFILAMSIRVYWIGQKQAFHTDELSSKFVAFKFVKKTLDTFYSIPPKTLSGYYLKKMFFQKAENTLKSDISDLRNNNNEEWSHPCLYFVFLRCISEFSNNYTPQGYKYYGCGLNLILFIFSFFIMRKILIRLFGDNKLVPIGLAVAFLNTGTISATLLIRPYELQMLGFILISYVYLVIYDKLKNNDVLIFRDSLWLLISLSFTFLCGYFLWFYVSFLGLILLKQAWLCKKNVKILFISFVVSIIVTISFYKGYFLVFNDYLFESVVSNDNISLNNSYYKTSFFIKNLIDFLFYKSIIFILLVGLFFKKNNNKNHANILFMCSLLWAYLVAQLDPYGTVKYIFPAFPILSLFIINFIFKLDNKKIQNIIIILLFSIYFLSAVFPYKSEDRQSKITYNSNYFYLPFAGKLENLFQVKVPHLNPEYEVIIVSRQWYNIMYLVSTLNNNQLYNINCLDSVAYDIDTLNLNHFYVLSDEVPLKINFKKYDVKKLSPYFLYRCFEVTKKVIDEK